MKLFNLFRRNSKQEICPEKEVILTLEEVGRATSFLTTNPRKALGLDPLPIETNYIVNDFLKRLENKEEG